MDLEWTDDRCILCALTLTERRSRCSETSLLTEEHLIPDAIGGRLTCHFLCKHCNDLLGQLEARLKDDARIRLAIDNLKDSLPDLWTTMSEGQPYVAQGWDGTVGAKIKNGEIRVNSSRRPNGSLIRPLKDAPKDVRTMLQRRGATQDEIANAMASLKELPEGPRVKVADGLEVMKLTPADAYPALNSREIEPLALIKIGYEYLALHLGRKIFCRYFDPVRSALSTRRVVPSCCSVKPLRVRASGYRPFHGLAVKNTTSGIMVKIRLFGYLSYHVQFLEFQMVRARFCYTLHLDSRREEWTEI